jgi:hypothetical protein
MFRFVSGFSGATFLSVAGGSISDMFSNAKVGTWVFLDSISWLHIKTVRLTRPMAIYTTTPFLGPELGPLLSG